MSVKTFTPRATTADVSWSGQTRRIKKDPRPSGAQPMAPQCRAVGDHGSLAPPHLEEPAGPVAVRGDPTSRKNRLRDTQLLDHDV